MITLLTLQSFDFRNGTPFTPAEETDGALVHGLPDGWRVFHTGDLTVPLRAVNNDLGIEVRATGKNLLERVQAIEASRYRIPALIPYRVAKTFLATVIQNEHGSERYFVQPGDDLTPYTSEFMWENGKGMGYDAPRILASTVPEKVEPAKVEPAPEPPVAVEAPAPVSDDLPAGF